jgi:hypothetical protein
MRVIFCAVSILLVSLTNNFAQQPVNESVSAKQRETLKNVHRVFVRITLNDVAQAVVDPSALKARTESQLKSGEITVVSALNPDLAVFEIHVELAADLENYGGTVEAFLKQPVGLLHQDPPAGPVLATTWNVPISICSGSGRIRAVVQDVAGLVTDNFISDYMNANGK